MSRIRVGVVRGGPSSEYEISLKTGENVLRALPTSRYVPIDILLSKNGEWFMGGLPTDLGHIAVHVDVVWNALHGEFGEDGKVQQLFEQFGIPYTGSTSLSSAIGMHKGLAKERFSDVGMLVPAGDVVTGEMSGGRSALVYLRDKPYPFIVKPVTGGSSVATAIVHNDEELERAIAAALPFGDALVEEVIKGKEATVCVIDGGTLGEHFVLFPIEIVPPSTKEVFDYEAKYSGISEEICPGRFPLMTHSELRDLAVKAHKSVGARHYSRTDFIISEKGIYVLEINTLPGLTSESLVPKALRAGGVEFHEFLDHIIGLTLKRV
jgi:D-alanine-D-alanine ligase